MSQVQTSGRGDYHLGCPLCPATWKKPDLKDIARIAARHWNEEHNDELKHRYERIDTIERGGHHLHGNEYSIERVPVYLTSFDVMERIGVVDGKAVNPDEDRVCPDCLRDIPDSDDRIVVEERRLGKDEWRCRWCDEEADTERKKNENQSIDDFA